MEGEENKLTTFSTWTIMLGCNESNIIFQQHLCKLGQLRRSNGRNSATTRSIHTSRGETLHLLPAAGRGAVSLIRQLREREHCSIAQIPGRRGAARATHAQFYHVTVQRMTKYCVQHCQSICSYKASANNTFSIHYNVHTIYIP